MNNQIDFQIDLVTARYDWDRVLSVTTTTNTGLYGLMFGNSEHTTTTPAFVVKDAITGKVLESNTCEEPPAYVRPTYSVNVSAPSKPKSLIETMEWIKSSTNLHMFNPKFNRVEIGGMYLEGLMINSWDDSTNTGTAVFDFMTSV